MPVLKIQTNTEVKNKEKLMSEASAKVSEVLSKPEKFIMIHVEENPDMIFAGSGEPLAYLELKSISLPEDSTKAISAELCTFIQNKLNIPVERIYIEFTNARRHMFGYNGATF